MQSQNTNPKTNIRNDISFSSFGEKFTQTSPILQLMDDLGDALKSDTPINMLGGGNPAHIDAVDAAFLETLRQLDSGDFQTDYYKNPAVESMGNYSNPQGDATFLQALADFLNRHYSEAWGQEITAKNIALTNGSQNAFFYLFNLFSGKFSDGSSKNILLPLAPEYIGYNDVHINESTEKTGYFTSIKPHIEDMTHTNAEGMTEDGFFKYRVDFDALEKHPDLLAGNIGAICCSRPTNPTGNVLTDDEMMRLANIAKHHDIPLIVDNAYGMPFPNILFTDAALSWDDNTILCFSLSKTGLPGLRTGIIVAAEPIIEAVSALNAIVNLSPTRFGATIATPLIQNDCLKTLSDNHIQPFYHAKAALAVRLLKSELANADAHGKTYPMKIHKPEGAMFLWVWFEGLPITTLALYERLKAQGTIIIPSQHFFAGQDISDVNAYRHAHECIRMSFAQTDEVLAKGIAAIGAVVRALYDGVGLP